MNSTRKNIQKTSGTRKKYKPGQLVTFLPENCKFVLNEKSVKHKG